MSQAQLRRIEGLEHSDKKGLALFTKCNDGTFAPWMDGAPKHYGAPSAEDVAARVDRAHIDAMLSQGWNVILVEYKKYWRKSPLDIDTA